VSLTTWQFANLLIFRNLLVWDRPTYTEKEEEDRTPELKPSAQRCLTRFLLGILLIEPFVSLIYA
jgi:hypothetical protein